MGLLETAPLNHHLIHNYRAKYCKENKNYYYEKTDVINKKHYKLVRNPYSRAVISYVSRLKNPHFYPNSNGNGVSFKQFLYYINKVGSSINVIEQHLAQQYIEGEENFVSNYIYLEKSEEELQCLEKRYSLLHSPIKNIILSKHHTPKNKRNTKNCLADTPFTFQKLLQDFPSYTSFYDDEAEQLVREIFQKDFDTYKYPIVLNL